MTAASINFTTPVGRFVQGSTSTPKTKDAENRPLVVKTGANAGKPTQQFYIAIAIPKGAERHWAETAWGQPIWNLGHQCFPNVATRLDFAWKILDGDSQIPNKRGKKPCDTEGFKGNWIVRCGSTFAPTCWNKDGSQAVPADQIKCGYYIQVSVNCAGNDSQQQPGLYMNASMVALAAFGDEISQGADPASAGFGQGVVLPPGASATPPAAFTPPVGSVMPGQPPASPVYVPPPTGIVPGANPSNVAPNPAFIAVPGAPAPAPTPGSPYIPPPTPGQAPMAPVAPAAPVAPGAPPARVMLPAAQGVPYESFVAQGWTDDMLRQHGKMQ